MTESINNIGIKEGKSLYEEYVKIYDLMNYYNDSALALRFCNFLDEIIKDEKIQVRTILDLACGSGEPTIELAKRGYLVTGTDVSEKAIKYAKDKVNSRELNVTFKNEDAVDMDYHEKFDAVTMFYNSINLIGNNLKAMRKLLGNVYNSLRSGGIFNFDTINPITQALTLNDTRTTLRKVGDTDLYVNMTLRVNPVNLKMDSYAVVFINENGNTKMITHRDILQGYTANEIRILLEDAGFEQVTIYGDFNSKVPNPLRGRVLNVVARK